MLHLVLELRQKKIFRLYLIFILFASIFSFLTVKIVYSFYIDPVDVMYSDKILMKLILIPPFILYFEIIISIIIYFAMKKKNKYHP